MSERAIEAWLAEFARHLAVRGRRRRRILAEVAEHLRDAAASGRSAREAVARFGAPEALAYEFTPRRRALRVALLVWLPAAAAATVCAGMVYAVGQHTLRSGANDPQTQVAEDAATRLGLGVAIADVVPGAAVDLARSLGVTVTVVDDAGRIVATNGQLDGRPVRPPLGTLRAAEAAGGNVVTWQPRAGVRQAAVVTAFRGRDTSGTVVVARSLRLVEQRESELAGIVALGWVLALAASAAAALLVARWWRPGDPPGLGDASAAQVVLT